MPLIIRRGRQVVKVVTLAERREDLPQMVPNKAHRDTTIDEIHRTRQEIAEKFGGDIAAILEDARSRQAASGRTEWRRPTSSSPNQGNA